MMNRFHLMDGTMETDAIPSPFVFPSNQRSFFLSFPPPLPQLDPISRFRRVGSSHGSNYSVTRLDAQDKSDIQTLFHYDFSSKLTHVPTRVIS